MKLNHLSVTLTAIFVLMMLALVLAFGQPSFGWGRYEWEIVQPFEGRLHLQPYPMLEVARVLDSPDLGPVSIYPLSTPRSGRLTENTQALDGEIVSLNARVLCSGEITMLEVQENSIAPVTRVVQFPEPTSMKTQDNITLRGEISDLKSYLGFREPGFGDLLRSPAANSIRAGVPPVLVITDREGRQKIVILLDAKQQAVGSSILGMVAVPVEIQGTLWNWGGTPFLAADPATYRKLSFWD